MTYSFVNSPFNKSRKPGWYKLTLFLPLLFNVLYMCLYNSFTRQTVLTQGIVFFLWMDWQLFIKLEWFPFKAGRPHILIFCFTFDLGKSGKQELSLFWFRFNFLPFFITFDVFTFWFGFHFFFLYYIIRHLGPDFINIENKLTCRVQPLLLCASSSWTTSVTVRLNLVSLFIKPGLI